MLISMRVATALAIVSGLLAGCAPAVSTGGFDAPDPASKLYAIEAAVRTNNRDAAPAIVEQLDSDDPAVRLVAITALERLTGETHGYCYCAPVDERREAIDRWVAALSADDHADTNVHAKHADSYPIAPKDAASNGG